MNNNIDVISINLRKYADDRNLELYTSITDPFHSLTTFEFRNPSTYMNKQFMYHRQDPTSFVQNVIDDIDTDWFSDTKEETKQEKPQSYRDKLVEQIKLAGQDLVDRAESFVAEDLDLIGGFNISIDFPQDGPIEISTKMNTYCKGDKYYKEWKEAYDEVKTVLL